MNEKIFRVTFSDGSVAEYTAAELGPKLAEESRLADVLEVWDGYNYNKIFPKETA